MTQPIPTEGTLRAADGRALPLTETRVRGRLDGPVADVRVTQRFENALGEPIEAVYAFPLPAGASVYRLEMRIGERVVRAVVKEKKEAAAIYARARSEGRAATLLEQDSEEVFTLSVANVPDGASVEVELRYQELLAFDDGEWRFVFPMTTAERYVEMPEERLARARTGGGQRLGGARLPDLGAVRPPRLPSGERGPDVDVALEVRVDGGVEAVRCPSHLVEVEERGAGARIRLASKRAIANRDLVVAYRASAPGVRPDLRFERADDGDGTLLLTLTPSSDVRPSELAGKGAMKALRCANCGAGITDAKAVQTIPGVGPVVACEYCGALLAPSTERPATRAGRPRDVTLLVDRSASMRGAMTQVRAGVRALLEALPATDAIRVTAFDHDRETLGGSSAGFVGLAPELVERVDAFLAARPPRGGTELERMLEHAASAPVREGRTPVVVLVTDGAVGNAGRLTRRAKELLGPRRLFVLGCGPAPDRRLCARLAEVGRGAAEVLAPREAEGPALARFARKVRDGGPILTGLAVSFEGVEVDAALPSPIPDLHGGEPVQLLARYRAPGTGRLVITGITAEGTAFRQRVALTLPERGATPGLARLWARRRVDALLDEAEVEPRRADALVREATELALAHDLVTPHTSLVAEDDQAVADAPPRRVEQPLAQAEGAFDAELAELSARSGGGDAPMPRSRFDGERAELGAPSGGGGAPTPRSRAARPLPPPCAPRSLDLAEMPAGAATPAEAPPPPRAPMPVACAAPTPGSPPVARSYAGPDRGAAKRSGGILASMMKAADRFFGDDGDGDTLVDGVLDAPATTPAPPPIRCQVTYPADELAWLRARASGELDLVFLVDETGSMGSYIDEVKRHLRGLVGALRELPLCDSLRLGLVTYRDHPPQDHSYASRATALTDDIDAIERAVDAMVASGGGDGPESVTDGLADAVRMDWRPGAARVVVWFGDAPPHGVEPHGDGFPNGCPCGDHWYTQAESLREMGVAVYAVGCLPGLRSYVGAEEVFRTVAETARGRYLPLSRAHLLVPLMAAAAATELDRRRVDEHVAAALERYGAVLRDTDEAERRRWLTEVLRVAGVEARELRHDEAAGAVAPVASRPLTEADVEGALHRLRLAGRAA